MGKKDVCCGPSPADQKKWRAESDLRTLIDAETIKKDQERYKHAMVLAKDQKAALSKVTGGE